MTTFVPLATCALLLPLPPAPIHPLLRHPTAAMPRALQAAAAPEADAAAKVAAAVAAGTDAGTATADEAAGPSSSTAAGGGTNSNVGPVAATGASGERAQLRGSKRRRAAGRG